MSPDLKLATIYIMPLGGRDTDTVLAALERNKKFLRGEVAHRVNLKFAPDLRFRVDDRFDEAERIEKLLRTPAVQRDLQSDSDESE
jgi:ribosome-binding factor A